MKPLVSIIVPVYKVEDYLERCLDTLCRQSLKDIEIILVDDGSPDRSGKICDRYAKEDRRIKVLRHPENRGLSAARNTGIAYATADYLMFVDSDDWVHEDFCKLPYEYAMQHQADLVMFCYQRIKKDGSVRSIKKAEGVGSFQLTRLEAIEFLLQSVGVFPWNKLYRRRLFNNVSYPEGYVYEGTGTVYKTVLLSETIFYLDKVLYYYCYHEGSITTLRTEKVLRDWSKMYMQQYCDLAAWGYPEEKLETLLLNFAIMYCIRKRRDVSDPEYMSWADTLRSCKCFPESFTWKQKVLLVLFKYCPILFEWICILYGKKFDAV